MVFVVRLIIACHDFIVLIEEKDNNVVILDCIEVMHALIYNIFASLNVGGYSLPSKDQYLLSHGLPSY